MTTPAAIQYDADGVRDFTVRRPTIEFRIGDDVFHAPNVIAATKLKAMASAVQGLDTADAGALLQSGNGLDELVLRIAGLFRTLIGGADGRRFADRLLSLGRSAGDEGTNIDGTPIPPVDDPEPIDLLTQALPVLWFLMESYGLRPTVPSVPLPTGSTDGVQDSLSDGTPSTDGASTSE